MSRRIVTAVLALAAVVGGLGAPSASGVAVFTPTRFDDPNPPGACDANDCSLRGAIQAANVAPGPDEIRLQAGTYQLSILGSEEDGGGDGDLDITNDPLTIIGQGPGATFIDGGGSNTNERVFHVHSEATLRALTIRNSVDDADAGIWAGLGSSLTIDDVVVTGHSTTGQGAGIQTSGTLMITNSQIHSNAAVTGDAGVIQRNGTGAMTILDTLVSFNDGGNGGGACCTGVFSSNPSMTTLDRVTVTHNSSRGCCDGVYIGDGGFSIANTSITDNSAGISDCCAGLLAEAGPAPGTITNTTISGNTVTGQNGAGAILGQQDVTLRNVTVSNNSAVEEDAGIAIVSGSPTIILNNVTVTGNRANSDNTGTEQGAGISQGAASVTVSNSISFGNSAGGTPQDCFGTIASGGNNLIGTTAGCAYTMGAGDQIGLDPLLGPLADNGGPAPTHALLAGSPAINTGGPVSRGPTGTACESTDERGAPRTGCDIGAYELVKCGKATVNEIGTEGGDTLRGSTASDVMLGLGGKDKLNGAGGKDALCGGKGKDTLKGGGGKDFLKGEQGKDTCIGGSGRDRARACEKEKKI